MRASLLPGVFRNLVDNSKQFGNFRLFEIGREIHRRVEGLPEETPHLMAAVFSKDGDGAAGLFAVKHVAECLMAGVEVNPAEAHAYEHPERSGELVWRGEPVGRLFELHPALSLEGRAAVLDLDLAVVERLDTRKKRYEPLRRFPTSAFDLSVVAGLREPVGLIQKRLEAAAGPGLMNIEFVRQYTGAPLPDDRKSVSYRMTIGSGERTLSSDEVGAVRARVIESMRGFGYELRV